MRSNNARSNNNKIDADECRFEAPNSEKRNNDLHKRFVVLDTVDYRLKKRVF